MSTTHVPARLDPRLVTAWAYAAYRRERVESGQDRGFLADWRGESRSVRDGYRARSEAQIRRTFGRLLVWM